VARTPDTVRAQILDLARKGVSRNQIAKATGVGAGTISKIVWEAGIRFNGTLPAAMVEARAINVKERQVAARDRKLLIDELMDARVLKVLKGDGTWQTRVKTQGGGERFETVDFIPPDDARNVASSAAALASAFRGYAPLETEAATEAGKSVLDKLIEAHQIPPEITGE
jgi:hypothetical protein